MANILSLDFPIPEVIIPRAEQHTLSGRCIVQIGQMVESGQTLCVALGAQTRSTAIHASISGVIKAITEHAIVIQAAQSDRSDGSADVQNATACAPLKNRLNGLNNIKINDFKKTLQNAGIIGLGGAGFPTHQKTIYPCTHLIINGIECEPPITVDDCILRHYPDKIIEGIDILKKHLKPKYTHVAIGQTKEKAAALFKKALEQHSTEDPSILLRILPDHYPNGHSKLLISNLLNQKIPIDQHGNREGILVLNVGTVLAIYNAICLQKPCTDRWVTLTGDRIQNPGVYRIPIGTPVQTLIDGFKIRSPSSNQDLEVISGGHYMGENITHTRHAAVLKTTQCLIFRTPIPLAEEAPCIRCNACVPLCPVGLLPQQLYWYQKNDTVLEQYHLNSCIHCRLCDSVCPSHIPLAQYFATAKKNLRQKKTIQSFKEQSRLKFEIKNKRLSNLTPFASADRADDLLSQVINNYKKS